MESHSSSASFSSYSRFSHGITSSSSPSSSSPDSPSSQQPPSLDHHQDGSIAGAASIVPFLWEEKPGVRKQAEIPKETQKLADERHLEPSSQINPSSCIEDKNSSAIHSIASNKNPPPRAKFSPENHPPLRPPPRLLISSSPAYSAQAADHTLQRHHQYHRRLKLNHSPVGGHHKRRHQKGSSLDDDPFRLAMIVCTNEGKGSSSKGGCAGHRSGGGGELAKKVQDHSLQFDHCIPRHALSGTRSSKFQGPGRASDRLYPKSSVEVGVAMESSMNSSYSRSTCNDKGAAKVAYNSANCKSSVERDDQAKVRGSVEKAIVKEGKPPISAISRTHQARSSDSRSVDDIRLAGKALKALSVSKAGLHSVQQPSVDLSCGHAKKLSKIHDLLGCKSDRPFRPQWQINHKDG